MLDDIGIGAFERDAGYADPAGTTAGMMAGAIAGGRHDRAHTAVTLTPRATRRRRACWSWTAASAWRRSDC